MRPKKPVKCTGRLYVHGLFVQNAGLRKMAKTLRWAQIHSFFGYSKITTIFFSVLDFDLNINHKNAKYTIIWKDFFGNNSFSSFRRLPIRCSSFPCPWILAWDLRNNGNIGEKMFVLQNYREEEGIWWWSSSLLKSESVSEGTCVINTSKMMSQWWCWYRWMSDDLDLSAQSWRAAGNAVMMPLKTFFVMMLMGKVLT